MVREVIGIEATETKTERGVVRRPALFSPNDLSAPPWLLPGGLQQLYPDEEVALRRLLDEISQVFRTRPDFCLSLDDEQKWNQEGPLIWARSASFNMLAASCPQSGDVSALSSESEKRGGRRVDISHVNCPLPALPHFIDSLAAHQLRPKYVILDMNFDGKDSTIENGVIRRNPQHGRIIAERLDYHWRNVPIIAYTRYPGPATLGLLGGLNVCIVVQKPPIINPLDYVRALPNIIGKVDAADVAGLVNQVISHLWRQGGTLYWVFKQVVEKVCNAEGKGAASYSQREARLVTEELARQGLALGKGQIALEYLILWLQNQGYEFKEESSPADLARELEPPEKHLLECLHEAINGCQGVEDWEDGVLGKLAEIYHEPFVKYACSQLRDMLTRIARKWRMAAPSSKLELEWLFLVAHETLWKHGYILCTYCGRSPATFPSSVRTVAQFRRSDEWFLATGRG